MVKVKMVIFPLLLVLLGGCGSHVGSSAAPAKTTSINVNEIPASVAEMEEPTYPVDEIRISRSFGSPKSEEDEASFASITSPDLYETFVKAIRSGEKQNGMLDIRRADYDVVIRSEGERQAIQLWLDPQKDNGLYIDAAEQGAFYRLSSEVVEQLSQLIQEMEYSPDRAERNGDVVRTFRGVRNVEQWERFLTAVENGRHAEVQLTAYTIEGDPIFYNLEYDGDMIQSTYDNTLDSLGSPIKTTSFCERMVDETTENGKTYRLDGCQGQKEGNFSFFIPLEK